VGWGQRRIVAFTAQLCHAKITPSAPQCGDLAGTTPNHLKQDPKFGLGDFPHPARPRESRARAHPDGIGFEQSLPPA